MEWLVQLATLYLNNILIQGVMSGAIPWKLLKNQYFTESSYSNELIKLVHSPEKVRNDLIESIVDIITYKFFTFCKKAGVVDTVQFFFVNRKDAVLSLCLPTILKMLHKKSKVW